MDQLVLLDEGRQPLLRRRGELGVLGAALVARYPAARRYHCAWRGERARVGLQRGTITVIAATAAALLLAACAPDDPAVDKGNLAETSPAPTPQPPDSTIAEPATPETDSSVGGVRSSPTKSAYRPPTADLWCPRPTTVAPSSDAVVKFGHEWAAGTEPITAWTLDYGDGARATATTAADAESRLFQHAYKQPGSHTATFTVADTEHTPASTASCTVQIAHKPRAPTLDGDAGNDWGAPDPSEGRERDCHYNGTALWGNVRVVDFGEDLKVRAVDFGEDLRVRWVDFGATNCGEWREVDFGADFKVRFVDFGEDLKVRFTNTRSGR